MWNSHPWGFCILYYIKDCYFSYLFSLISLYIQSSIALFKEPSYSVERKRAFIRCYILNIIYFQWIHIQGLVNRQTQNHLNVNLSHLVLFFSVLSYCLCLQLPEEIPLQSFGPDVVPASDPGCLRDPVLLCGRVHPVQPGYQLPAQGQPCWKLHPTVSGIWY